MTLGLTLGMIIGPVQLEQPVWLLLVVVLAPLFVFIARSSLSGLGTTTHRLALAVRLLLLAIIAVALAEPSLRREAQDVAVTVILDASRSVPAPLQRQADTYFERTLENKQVESDQLGVITVARDARVQALPSKLNALIERTTRVDPNATDLAAAVRLAMAISPDNAAHRLVIASDGNETAGSLLQAAEAARAAGVPIDVLPLTYDHDTEIIVDRIVAPATARAGQTINVRVIVTATKPAAGRLTLLLNGEAIDLEPDSPELGRLVQLDSGTNPLVVPIIPPSTGPQRLEAIFEPLEGTGVDAIAENNRALAVTFVSGEGSVLVLATAPEEAGPMMDALFESQINAEQRPPDQAPTSLEQWNAFDAVVMLNQSAYDYSEAQQDQLRQFVHDSGGGLLMIGGPDAFGAGGWIGSPIEDALPIRLDPPQKRQMPRGALAIIVHSVEAPNGVFLGRQTARAAIGALSRLDLAGIIEYNYTAGTDWVMPMSEVGDGSRARQAINNLTFGDMQDFAPSLRVALGGLSTVDAGQRHLIIISDGDPSMPPTPLLQSFEDAGISISTVGVFPHSGSDTRRMSLMSQSTGGNHYNINTQAALANVPQIFIKEAQTVRRSLIWEGDPFSPTLIPIASEPMRGIASVPPVSGYVVAAEREGLALVTLRGQENDPVAAQWQHGLGKVVTFTSDATTRWGSAWVAWPQFKQFWEQHVRWAMRPGGSADVRITTENRGDETVVLVDMLDAAGDPVNFANLRARASTPDGTGLAVDLAQIAPGTYQGVFPSGDPGTYVLGVNYDAPASESRPALEGSAQAAVARPFADEFRALEDNAALLRQVAATTGGQVLTDDPRQADLWRRAGVTMPVTTRPIWLALTLAAIALFIADVGIRRVRLDPAAVGRAMLRVARPKAGKSAAELSSLQAARAKAREAIDQRASQAPAKPTVVASRKFEADPSATASPDPVAPAATAPTPTTKPKPDAADAPEEGMSRLLAAKRRAQGDSTPNDPSQS